MGSISVVIPTKGRPQLLEKCLKSLETQKMTFLEVVVVDSSRSGRTKEVVQKYHRSLKTKYVYESSLGYPLAYNTGVKLAQGDYIAFLNDDCLVSKNWSEKIVETLHKYPNNIIQGKSISVPKKNIYASIMGDHYKNWVRSHLIATNRLDTFDAKCSVIPRSLFYKKGKFAGFDERLVKGSEDIEMGQRLIAEGKEVVYYPKIVIYHKERTTLTGFVKQHLRIAQAEAALTKKTKYGNVPIFPGKKTILNLNSLLKREVKYLKNFELVKAIYLLFLYFLLFWIRVFGYTLKQ